jgi:hypothetical protein
MDWLIKLSCAAIYAAKRPAWDMRRNQGFAQPLANKRLPWAIEIDLKRNFGKA